MECNITFVGPVGSGKTQFIRAVSDIPVLDTDEAPTDTVAMFKDKTTVAMDVGMVDLGQGMQVRLYGAPGQERFRFMWDVLLEQSRGVVLLIDHSAPNPFLDFSQHLLALRNYLRGSRKPVVAGITHVDLAPSRSLFGYYSTWRMVSPKCPPIFELDARDKRDARALLTVMAAMLEMSERVPTHEVF